MAGILIGVGAMEATEEEDKAQAQAQAEADGTAKCNETKCPPCKTISGKIVPVGTIGYRLDLVPPSKPHYPYSGNHIHLRQANQNPETCRCFWGKEAVIDASQGQTPPVGAIPLEKFIN